MFPGRAYPTLKTTAVGLSSYLDQVPVVPSLCPRSWGRDPDGPSLVGSVPISHGQVTGTWGIDVAVGSHPLYIGVPFREGEIAESKSLFKRSRHMLIISSCPAFWRSWSSLPSLQPHLQTISWVTSIDD